MIYDEGACDRSDTDFEYPFDGRMEVGLENSKGGFLMEKINTRPTSVSQGIFLPDKEVWMLTELRKK